MDTKWIIEQCLVLFVGLLGAGIAIYIAWDRTGNVTPLINVAAPSEPGRETIVPVRNEGNVDSVVLGARLYGGDWYGSQQQTYRGKSSGELLFTSRNCRSGVPWTAVLVEPIVIEAGKVKNLRVSIVEPHWPERAYVGWIVLETENGPTPPVRIALDVLPG